MTKLKVGVVGAGVIGMCSAVHVQRLEPEAEVTIISENFSPNTTGDGAAGLWTPFLCGKTPAEKVKKWSTATHDFLWQLWNMDNGGKMGISLMPAIRVTSSDYLDDHMWKDAVYGYRVLTKREIDALRTKLKIPTLKYGAEFITFICEPSKLLPHLLEQFKINGGKVLRQKVTDLRTLKSSFDVVINCTGLGSHHVMSDKEVKPIRGQVLKVEAPTVSLAFMVDDDDGHYIIPNQHVVTLGGTHQENDWDTNPRKTDTEFIKKGCYNIVPSLKHANILREWAGLRPGRLSVRLETEQLAVPGSAPLSVVHNYGHGGSGVTLCWGCGLEAAEQALKASHSVSKL